MQVLTEEEITAIGVGAKKYARAVEAAVLDKLRQQNPIAEVVSEGSFGMEVISLVTEDYSVLPGTKLYAAPAPSVPDEGGERED